MEGKQGGLMSSWKKSPQNMAQPIFLSKLIHNFFPRKKVAQTFWLFLQFSKKLPNETYRPIGENSPNLVTL
jgi:hypothetical protein